MCMLIRPGRSARRCTSPAHRHVGMPHGSAGGCHALPSGRGHPGATMGVCIRGAIRRRARHGPTSMIPLATRPRSAAIRPAPARAMCAAWPTTGNESTMARVWCMRSAMTTLGCASPQQRSARARSEVRRHGRTMDMAVPHHRSVPGARATGRRRTSLQHCALVGQLHGITRLRGACRR